MKYFALLLCTIYPITSFTMETENKSKPTITMSHEFDSLVRKCRYPRTISHTIDIPEEGAIFELSSQLLDLHPEHTKLDIEKGIKSITISELHNPHEFNIIDNTSRNLAKIYVVCNPK